MRHARQHDPIDIFANLPEGLRSFRRRRRQRLPHVARLDQRYDAPIADRREIVRHPIREAMRLEPELFQIHCSTLT